MPPRASGKPERLHRSMGDGLLRGSVLVHWVSREAASLFAGYGRLQDHTQDVLDQEGKVRTKDPDRTVAESDGQRA